MSHFHEKGVDEFQLQSDLSHGHKSESSFFKKVKIVSKEIKNADWSVMNLYFLEIAS